MVFAKKVHHNDNELLTKIENIFIENKSKRVAVVGTTCTGKSTLIRQLRERGIIVHDMDDLVFPKLTKQEANEVNATPWTEEIGKLMDKLAKKYVKVVAGEPVFGTIVFDSDLIVHLKIGDQKLKERVASRNVSFENAKNMQKQIEEQIKKSKIDTIEIIV